MNKVSYFILALLGLAVSYIWSDVFFRIPEYFGIALITFGAMGLIGLACTDKDEACRLCQLK